MVKLAIVINATAKGIAQEAIAVLALLPKELAQMEQMCVVVKVKHHTVHIIMKMENVRIMIAVVGLPMLIVDTISKLGMVVVTRIHKLWQSMEILVSVAVIIKYHIVLILMKMMNVQMLVAVRRSRLQIMVM